MGLLGKVVRKATPRPVRQVTRVVRHPVRTGIRAATPRPIRNVQRSVYNAAHPISAAENALLNGLTGSSRRRKTTSGAGSRSVPGYSGGAYATGPSSNAAAYERMELGEQIEQAEAALFSRHLGSFAPPSAPVAPDATAPDPSATRTRLEREVGLADLEAQLAPFGDPPVVRVPDAVDRPAIFKDLFTKAAADVPRWRWGARRTIRAESRVEAARRARAEAERRRGQQHQEQETLNLQRAQLDQLRARVNDEVARWVEEELARRQVAQADAQSALDDEWQKLLANDPEAVSVALRGALTSDRIAVVGCSTGKGVVVLTIPDLSEVIADREPACTPAGRPTLRKRTKTQMNQLYLAAIASETLRVAAAGFAAAPRLEAVRSFIFREDEAGDPQPIYAGTFTRAGLDSLPGRRSADPDALAGSLEAAEDLQIKRKGRAQEIRSLDPHTDPALQVVIDWLDSERRRMFRPATSTLG